MWESPWAVETLKNSRAQKAFPSYIAYEQKGVETTSLYTGTID